MTSLPRNKMHEHYMKMALSFAMRGTGSVSPNPRIGCVIVDYSETESGRLVSWGYHKRFGGPHAEAEALKKAGKNARGCTVYVNLEPCCHTGKTPPCCNALIEAGVSRVVSGMLDPNPLVRGGGKQALEAAGIEFVNGVLEEDCRWLNRGFIRNMTLGRPWVTAKAAISLDGDMALEDGESKWISGPLSRKRAHLMRAENDAVMVGIGTILQDDPMLTVRDVDGKSPIKVVVDRHLDTPPDAKVLDHGGCVFMTGPSPDEERVNGLLRRGAKVIRQEVDSRERIPIDGILRELNKLGVNNLLLEGGSKLISSFINADAIDEYSLFIAPKVLGRGLRMSDDVVFNHMGETISMKQVRLRRIGDDLWFEGLPSCSPAL